MLALAGFSAGGGFAAAAALIGLQPVIPAEQRFVANTLFIGAVTLAGYGIGPWLTGILSDSLGHHKLSVTIALVTAATFSAPAVASIVRRLSPLTQCAPSPVRPRVEHAAGPRRQT